MLQEILIFTKNLRVDTASYTSLFNSYLEKNINFKAPVNLYDPIRYIMSIGGKRIRPSLALMSCDLFDADPNLALDVALTIEMFHNFTLIHDDIMDKADLRRGQETVHKKWDLNTGILSGDALMILAYQRLNSYPERTFKQLMELFTQTAIEVCEGQQMDIDFESRTEVELQEYYTMITYKTAVLLGCSLQMGSIVAEAKIPDQKEIYSFGMNLGLAFQLQDDYLDTFGGEGFGKRIGGDIIENKKTFLYIRTLELAGDEDQNRLLELYRNTVPNNEKEENQKIEEVRNLFVKCGVDQFLLEEIKDYTERALANIEQLNVKDSKKDLLRQFSMALMNRKI